MQEPAQQGPMDYMDTVLRSVSECLGMEAIIIYKPIGNGGWDCCYSYNLSESYKFFLGDAHSARLSFVYEQRRYKVVQEAYLKAQTNIERAIYMPLINDQDVIGVCVYFDKKETVSDDSYHHYETSTQILSVTCQQALYFQQMAAQISSLEQEIIKRKKLEKALRRSEDQFRVIFDGATDGVVVADPQTKKFVYANQEVCRMTGYSVEEIMHLDVSHFHPREDLDYVLAQFERQMKKEIRIARNLPILCKDDSIVYCDVDSRPMEFLGRQYLVGYFRDITDKRRSEEALHISESRFRDLFNYAPVPLWDMDLTRTMGYFTNRYEETNLALDEFLDQNPEVLEKCIRLIDTIDLNRYAVELTGVKDKRKIIESIDNEYMVPGTRFVMREVLKNLYAGNKKFEVEAQVVRSTQEKLFIKTYCIVPHIYEHKILLATVDMSQQKIHAELLEALVDQRTLELKNINLQLADEINVRKQAEEAYRQSEEHLNWHRQQLIRIGRAKSMSMMASSIAHQINQPLTVISSYSQACINKIQQGDASLDALSYPLTKIVEHVGRVGNIIHSMKDFFITSNLNREVVNVYDLIEDAIELVDYRGIAKSCIDKQYINHHQWLFIDKLQVEHVLLNILQNAVDALYEQKNNHPTIMIATIINAGGFVISVADNGPGVSHEVQKQIFETFFTTKDDGMGVGLAICSAVVEAHGGSLKLATSADGGAEFYFTLPL